VIYYNYMQKYSLYIFIGISAVLLIMTARSAGDFMAILDTTQTIQYSKSTTTTSTNTKDDTGTVSNGDTGRVGAPVHGTSTQGKVKADVFSGKLEEVNTGCFADGECYVVVDGKHVTTLRGWSRDTVGTVQGVEGFGDLEKYIGKNVEVYAQVNPDNTYTLYGSEGFYVKLGDGKSPTPTPAPTKPVAGAGCVIGGCSSQLCVDAGKGDVATTCEWTEAYACYQTAQCEKQATGQCGWTETKELNQCLLNAKSADAIPVQ
jgi:hypothetical protein